jgi:hypothetical protein
MSRLEFYGFPAWVGTISSPTKCAWWAADPNQLGWDQQALFESDFAMTTSAALTGAIRPDQVEVDDHVSQGGRTTIGPRWPGGAMVGACWIPAARWNQLATPPQRAQATAGGRDYEYTVIQYFDNEQSNRRFYGFHAKLAATPKGGLSLLELWSPGTSIANPTPAGRWWLDLGVVADPRGPTIDPSTTEGPIYIDQRAMHALPDLHPKLPQLVGTFGFPPPRQGL